MPFQWTNKTTCELISNLYSPSSLIYQIISSLITAQTLIEKIFTRFPWSTPDPTQLQSGPAPGRPQLLFWALSPLLPPEQPTSQYLSKACIKCPGFSQSLNWTLSLCSWISLWNSHYRCLLNLKTFGRSCSCVWLIFAVIVSSVSQVTGHSCAISAWVLAKHTWVWWGAELFGPDSVWEGRVVWRASGETGLWDGLRGWPGCLSGGCQECKLQESLLKSTFYSVASDCLFTCARKSGPDGNSPNPSHMPSAFPRRRRRIVALMPRTLWPNSLQEAPIWKVSLGSPQEVSVKALRDRNKKEMEHLLTDCAGRRAAFWLAWRALKSECCVCTLALLFLTGGSSVPDLRVGESLTS